MSFLYELEAVIQERKKSSNEKSYTAALFKGGIDRILKKIGEESGEVIIAAKNHNKEELKNETADLLYHLLVTLSHENIQLKEVEAILQVRHTPKNKKIDNLGKAQV